MHTCKSLKFNTKPVTGGKIIISFGLGDVSVDLKNCLLDANYSPPLRPLQ